MLVCTSFFKWSRIVPICVPFVKIIECILITDITAVNNPHDNYDSVIRSSSFDCYTLDAGNFRMLDIIIM